MTRFKADYAATIRAGRAYIRLIEAVAVLIEWTDDDRERQRLSRLRRHYQDALRQLVDTLPAHITAQIMVASEKVLGTVHDVGNN